MKVPVSSVLSNRYMVEYPDWYAWTHEVGGVVYKIYVINGYAGCQVGVQHQNFVTDMPSWWTVF